MKEQFWGMIQKVRRWIALRDLIRRLVKAVTGGLLAGTVCEAIAYFVPWYSVNLWAAGCVLTGVLAAFVWTLVKYPSGREAAGQLDRTGLQERVQTAWELVEEKKGNVLFDLQLQDAWDAVAAVPYQKRLPIRIRWQQAAAAGLFLAIFMSSVILPSPAKEQAQSVHAVQEQAKKELEKVKKAYEEIAQDSELSRSGRMEALGTLEEIEKELKEARSQQALSKAAERAQRKLEQAMDRSPDLAAKAALTELQRELAESSSQKSQGAGMADAGGTKNPQTAEAGAATDGKGQNGEESEPDAQNGDEKSTAGTGTVNAQGAESATGTGTVNPQGTGSATGTGTVSSGTASGSATENKGPGRNSGTGNGGSGSDGTGAKEAGNGEGNSGDGDGNAGSGNGAGNGSGPGSNSGSGSGSGSGASGGWNYGSKSGRKQELEYDGEHVSVPQQTGDDENLTGRASEGESYKERGGDSLTWEGESVAYDQVVGEYADQAMSQIQKSRYPAGVQDLVKTYFDGIVSQ